MANPVKEIARLGLTFLILFTRVEAGEHQLQIVVDPRIELLAVVQSLGDYGSKTGLITTFDFSYKREVADYFRPFGKERAVEIFGEMSGHGFNFDAPPTAMLFFSDPPEILPRHPVPEEILERAGGREKLDEFMGALREFAKKSDFMKFYESRREWYARIAGCAQDSIHGDYVRMLENYYGMTQASYTIILAPLVTGGFGPRVEVMPGHYSLYNICGPIGMQDSLPNFGTVENFRHIAWHEFSHSFVNPATDRFGKDVDRYSGLFDRISDEMHGMAYSNWRTCVNEHIVRAVTTRLTYREAGKAAGDASMRRERGRGFAYIRELCSALEDYENRRERYATFVDFYPKLVDVFAELSGRHLGDDFYTIPFEGPISAATTGTRLTAYVLPTGETDHEAQDSIHGYVRRIRDRFDPKSRLLTDREALAADLSHYTLFLYGTVHGNRWLAEHASILPAVIDTDRIIADSVYTGTHLRLITAVRSPYDTTKAVVIYTAQAAADINGINAVFHGATDFVIARGKEAVKSGNYRKSGGRWHF